MKKTVLVFSSLLFVIAPSYAAERKEIKERKHNSAQQVSSTASSNVWSRVGTPLYRAGFEPAQPCPAVQSPINPVTGEEVTTFVAHMFKCYEAYGHDIHFPRPRMTQDEVRIFNVFAKSVAKKISADGESVKIVKNFATAPYWDTIHAFILMRYALEFAREQVAKELEEQHAPQFAGHRRQ